MSPRARRALLVLMSLAGLAAASVVHAQPAPAQDFVNGAAQSDAYEIAAGELALTQSADPEVKRFAQQMIQDHRKTSADLAQAAAAASLAPPPPVVGGDQARMLSALQSQKGPDLDRSFWTQQVNAHTAALVTQQDYVAKGTEPHLRALAQAAAPLIQRHLEMARRAAAAAPPAP